MIAIKLNNPVGKRDWLEHIRIGQLFLFNDVVYLSLGKTLIRENGGFGPSNYLVLDLEKTQLERWPSNYHVTILDGELTCNYK